MPFGYEILNEVSVIAIIDGADCSEEESFLGYWGLVIWICLAIYLMVGQFVICEEYFVPILAQLGDRWKMAEDVQGATLLAVGSSSPELFTALLGVIFYPDDNPGPGTNVGSAVFNMCIIIGLSAIFAPKAVKLKMVPFLRDSIAYMIGLVQLYLFYAVITPGKMDIWESILLTAWWVLYVFAVYRTDLLAVRCCCCINETVDPIEDEIELHEMPANKHGHQAIVTADGGDIENKNNNNNFNDRNHHKQSAPLPDLDQNPDNIHIAPGAIPEDAMDDDLQNLLDALNKKQRQNVNKGWIIVVMPNRPTKSRSSRLHLPVGGRHGHNNNDGNNKNDQKHNDSVALRASHQSHTYVRRRTLLETLKHEREQRESQYIHQQEHGGGGHGHGGHGADTHSRGDIILHKFLKPWTSLFGCTLPAPEGSFVSKHIYLSIMAIVVWLGILTFFVVDCSEKIGQCFGMPGGLLGITLLAVGSSLPDCISSVIVARQCKIDMAVANAFGSNIFDVNLCVGFAFILGSIAKAIEGESTSLHLGDGHSLITFIELIIAAAGFLIFLWFMMWCTLFRLEKWMGYILNVAYVGYICVFTVLFVHAADAEGGDGHGER